MESSLNEDVQSGNNSQRVEMMKMAYVGIVENVKKLISDVQTHFNAGRYHVLYAYFALGVQYLEHIELRHNELSLIQEWDRLLKEGVHHLDEQASHPVMRDALVTLTRQYAAMLRDKYPALVKQYAQSGSRVDFSLPIKEDSGDKPLDDGFSPKNKPANPAPFFRALEDAVTLYYRKCLPDKKEDPQKYPRLPAYQGGPNGAFGLSKEDYQTLKTQCINVIHDNPQSPQEILMVLTGLWRVSFPLIQSGKRITDGLQALMENILSLLLKMQGENVAPEAFFSEWRIIHEYLIFSGAYPAKWKARMVPEDLSLKALWPEDGRDLKSLSELLGDLIQWMAGASYAEATSMIESLFEISPLIEHLQPTPTPFYHPGNCDEHNPLMTELYNTRAPFHQWLNNEIDFFSAQKAASEATFLLLDKISTFTWALLEDDPHHQSQFMITGSTVQSNRTGFSDVEGGYFYHLPSNLSDEQQRKLRALYLTHARLIDLVVISLRETLPNQAGFRIDASCHPLYPSIKADDDAGVKQHELLAEAWGHGPTFGPVQEVFENLTQCAELDGLQLVNDIKLRSFFFAVGRPLSANHSVTDVWHEKIRQFLKRELTQKQFNTIAADYLARFSHPVEISRQSRWTYRQIIPVLMYGHLLKDACREIQLSTIGGGEMSLLSLKTAYFQPLTYLPLALTMFHQYKSRALPEQIDEAVKAGDLKKVLGDILKQAILLIGEWRERQYHQLFEELSVPLQDDVILLVSQEAYANKLDHHKAITTDEQRLLLTLLYEGLIQPLNTEMEQFFVSYSEQNFRTERLRIDSVRVVNAYIDACHRLIPKDGDHWLAYPLIHCIADIPKKSGGTLRQTLEHSKKSPVIENKEPSPIFKGKGDRPQPYSVTSLVHSAEDGELSPDLLEKVVKGLKSTNNLDEDNLPSPHVIEMDFQGEHHTVTVFYERTLAGEYWALTQLAQLMGLSVAPPAILACLRASNGQSAKEGWLIIQTGQKVAALNDSKESGFAISQVLSTENYTHAFLFFLLTAQWQTAHGAGLGLLNAVADKNSVLFLPYHYDSRRANEDFNRDIAAFFMLPNLLQPLSVDVLEHLELLNPADVVTQWQTLIKSCNEKFVTAMREDIISRYSGEQQKWMLASIRPATTILEDAIQLQGQLISLKAMLQRLRGDTQQEVNACDVLVHMDYALATTAVMLARENAETFLREMDVILLDDRCDFKNAFWTHVDFAQMVNSDGKPNEEQQAFYLQLLLEQKPALSALRLSHCCVLTGSDLQKLLSIYPHIEEVDVSYCEKIDSRALGMLANCQKLTVLRMDGNSHFGELVIKSHFLNNQFLHLETLSLQNSPNLTVVDVRLPQLKMLWLSGSKKLRYVHQNDGFLTTLHQHALQAYQGGDILEAVHLIRQAEVLVPLIHNKESSIQWDILRFSQLIQAKSERSQVAQKVLQRSGSFVKRDDIEINIKDFSVELPNVYDIHVMEALFSAAEMAQSHRCLLQIEPFNVEMAESEDVIIREQFRQLFENVINQLKVTQFQTAVVLTPVFGNQWICMVMTHSKEDDYQLTHFLDPINGERWGGLAYELFYNEVIHHVSRTLPTYNKPIMLAAGKMQVEQSGCWIAYALDYYLGLGTWLNGVEDELDWQSIYQAQQERWLQSSQAKQILRQRQSPAQSMSIAGGNPLAINVAQAAIVANDEWLLQVFFKGLDKKPRFHVNLPQEKQNSLKSVISHFLSRQEALLEQHQSHSLKALQSALEKAESEVSSKLLEVFEQYYCRHPEFAKIYQMSTQILSQIEKSRVNRFARYVNQLITSYSTMESILQPLLGAGSDEPVTDEIIAMARQRLGDLKTRYIHHDSDNTHLKGVCITLWQQEARELAAKEWLKQCPESSYPEVLRQLSHEERVNILTSELSPNAVDENGVSLLQYAMQHERYQMVYYLRCVGAKNIFLPIAVDVASSGNVDLLEVLLDGEALFRNANWGVERKLAALMETQYRLLREESVLERQLEILTGASRQQSVEQLNQALSQSMQVLFQDFLKRYIQPLALGRDSLAHDEPYRDLWASAVEESMKKLWWKGRLIEKEVHIEAWNEATNERYQALIKEMEDYSLRLKNTKQIQSKITDIETQLSKVKNGSQNVLLKMAELQHIQNDVEIITVARARYRMKKRQLAEALYDEGSLPESLRASSREESIRLLMNIRLPLRSLVDELKNISDPRGCCKQSVFQTTLERGDHHLLQFLIQQGAVNLLHDTIEIVRKEDIGKKVSECKESIEYEPIAAICDEDGNTFLHRLILQGQGAWLYDYVVTPKSRAALAIMEICDECGSSVEDPTRRSLLALVQQPLLMHCSEAVLKKKNKGDVAVINSQHPVTLCTLLHDVIELESEEWLRESVKPTEKRRAYYGPMTAFLLRQGADVLIDNVDEQRALDLVMHVKSSELQKYWLYCLVEGNEQSLLDEDPQKTWSGFQSDMLNYLKETETTVKRRTGQLNEQLRKTQSWFFGLLKSRDARERALAEIKVELQSCHIKLEKVKEGELVTLVGHNCGDDGYTIAWADQEANAVEPIDDTLQLNVSKAIIRVSEDENYALVSSARMTRQLALQTTTIQEQAAEIRELKDGKKELEGKIVQQDEKIVQQDEKIVQQNERIVQQNEEITGQKEEIATLKLKNKQQDEKLAKLEGLFEIYGEMFQEFQKRKTEGAGGKHETGQDDTLSGNKPKSPSPGFFKQE